MHTKSFNVDKASLSTEVKKTERTSDTVIGNLIRFASEDYPIVQPFADLLQPPTYTNIIITYFQVTYGATEV
jgi:hypothetical protein